MRLAQIIFAIPLGIVLVVASIAFSVSPSEPMDAVDYLVAAWACTMGVANLAIARRLPSGGEQVRRWALRLVGAHVAFSLVKLTAYGEGAAVVFLAFDAALLALLARRRAVGLA